MKRLGVAATAALSFVLCVAAPALAGTNGSAGSDRGGPGVGGAGGTAFTGTDIHFGLIALAVLVLVGATALLVSRRRSAAQS